MAKKLSSQNVARQIFVFDGGINLGNRERTVKFKTA
jgi:hypothetical protein